MVSPRSEAARKRYFRQVSGGQSGRQLPPVTHSRGVVAGACLDLGHLVRNHPRREPGEQLAEQVRHVQLGEHKLGQRVGLKVDTAGRREGHPQPVRVQEALEATGVAQVVTVQQGRQRLGQLHLAVPVRRQGLAEPLQELARFRGAGALDPGDGLVDAL